MPFDWTHHPERPNWTARWIGTAGDVEAEVLQIMPNAPHWRSTLRRGGQIVGVHEMRPTEAEAKALAEQRLAEMGR